MKIELQTYILVLIILIITSCNIINPSENIPTYIAIDSVVVKPSIPTQPHGSVSSRITDVWAYFDNNLLGPFELPCKIPVLATHSAQVVLIAGIWDNGLSNTRNKYPFYTIDTFMLTPSPTQTIKRNPHLYYRSNINVKLNEDFEQGNSFIKKSGDTNLSKVNDSQVFEGNWSGKITLDNTHRTSENITSQVITLNPASATYLEMNYKADMDFVLRGEYNIAGILYYADIIGIRSKNNWNKIYINLQQFTSSYASTNNFYRFIIQTTLPSTMQNGSVYIDNFKIITQ